VLPGPVVVVRLLERSRVMNTILTTRNPDHPLAKPIPAPDLESLFRAHEAEWDYEASTDHPVECSCGSYYDDRSDFDDWHHTHLAQVLGLWMARTGLVTKDTITALTRGIPTTLEGATS
jgi:hypothetical protein